MVHGGLHAGWTWEHYGQFFADNGWDCHALDWHNHGRSTALPQADFIKRTHTDLHREILTVTRQFPTFHLMGHSMGALAALISSTLLRPESVTLLAPVPPAEVGAEIVPMVVDRSQLFPVPPFDMARAMFYPTMTGDEAHSYYTRLQPESSQLVWESAQRNISVDLDAVRAPVLTIAAGEDRLTPSRDIQRLAKLLDATHLDYPDLGHCDLLLRSGGWQQVASDIEAWLPR
jgi:pimeloyl-ACP methyl ester carboxylesterase